MGEPRVTGLTVGEVREACGTTHHADGFRVILKVRLPGGRVVEKDVSPRSVLPSIMDVLVEAEVEITEDDFAEPEPYDPLCD